MSRNIIIALISLIVGVAVSLFFFKGCSVPERVIIDRTNEARLYTALNYAKAEKQAYKDSAEALSKVNDSLIKNGRKIVYRTKFDTLATIDTVFIELVKCDSVVNILDSAVVGLKKESGFLKNALIKSETEGLIKDSIIVSKTEENAILAKENNRLEKRVKRTSFVNKVLVGIIAVLSVFGAAR
jgi:hypothetical protein